MATRKARSASGIKIRLGRRIRDLRAEKRIMLFECAEHAGLSVEELQAIEGGDVDVSLALIVKLAEVLGVEPLDVVNVDMATSPRARLVERFRLASPARRAELLRLLERPDEGASEKNAGPSRRSTDKR